MIDNQRVTWTAFAILAMFNIQERRRRRAGQLVNTTRWRRGSAGMNRRSFLDEWQRWKIWFKIQTAQCCETQPLLLLFEFRRPGWSERT